MYQTLARQRVVWLYFAAMFAYGRLRTRNRRLDVEFSAPVSRFGSPYHGCGSGFLLLGGLLTAGCLVGMLLLKIFDSRKVLIGACVGALSCLSAALFGPARVSVIAFPAVGLFASVMWPIVVSLALNSVAEFHGSFSGILGTGIIGGGGSAGDHWAHRRLRWTAQRLGISLRHVWGLSSALASGHDR